MFHRPIRPQAFDFDVVPGAFRSRPFVAVSRLPTSSPPEHPAGGSSTTTRTAPRAKRDPGRTWRRDRPPGWRQLSLRNPLLPGVLDLRAPTTLAEAAAVLQAARAFLGIDSGLMWMAASLQVPTVGL